MYNAAQKVPILHIAEVVWLLHIKAGCLGVLLHHAGQGICIRDTTFLRHNDYFCIAAKAVCLNHLNDPGIGCSGNIDRAPLPVPAHGCCLGRCRCAVIDGCIGCVHARQLAYHGLVLKYGLEDALADFRLIRRIGSDKFLLGYHAGYNGRYVMVISTCPAEDVAEHHVLTGYVLHLPDYSLLAETRHKIQAVLQLYLLRDMGKHFIETVESYLTKHFLLLLLRIRHIRPHKLHLISGGMDYFNQGSLCMHHRPGHPSVLPYP